MLWSAGAPARAALVLLVRAYRATLSGWLGGQCRFYPTCSRYTEDAIRNRGALRGSLLAMWRVLRCNPFGAGGVERAPAGRYENVIRDHHGAEI
jgi:putative membrane protein insertion efficiency factor